MLQIMDTPQLRKVSADIDTILIGEIWQHLPIKRVD